MFFDLPASTSPTASPRHAQFSLRALFSLVHVATLVSAAGHLILVALWVALIPLGGALILGGLLLVQFPIYLVLKCVLGPLVIENRESSP